MKAATAAEFLTVLAKVFSKCNYFYWRQPSDGRLENLFQTLFGESQSVILAG